jgi:hypothetical protein
VLATLSLGAAAAAQEGLTLGDLLDGASFRTPSGLEFSEFYIDEFDVELARDTDVIVLFNGFQFFFEYDDVDPEANAGFDLRYLVRAVNDPESPGREPRMGSVVLSVENTDGNGSGKSFFESGSIVFEGVESGIEESSQEMGGILFGSGFVHVDHGVRLAGAKKATRKKATRRKATRKKATRKKATRKKATRKKATRKKATRKKATSETADVTESGESEENPVRFSEVDDIVFIGGSGQVFVAETYWQVGEEIPQEERPQ